MAYKLPPLRFGYDALEPYLDKHHHAYVDKLNETLAPYPHLADKRLRDARRNPSCRPR